MRNVALFLLLLPLAASSQEWYWADGRRVSQKRFDGSVNDMMIVHGGPLAYMTPDWDSLILYTPIAGKVVAVRSTDSISAIRRAAAFDLAYYLKSDNFKDDFEYLKEHMAGRSDILKLLGQPKSITRDKNKSNVEYFHYDFYDLEIRDEGKLHAINRRGIDKPSLYPLKLRDISLISLGEYIVGFSIEYRNTSNKDIKYIYTTVKAFNSVNDFIGTKIGKGIGPLEPGENGYYKFNDLFFSKVIDRYEVTKVRIVFMDGTENSYQNKQVELLY